MGRGFGALLRKDFKLMLSGKFFLLAAGSLLVYSFYINMVYVRLNQEIYPVIVYDPLELQNKGQQPPAIMVESQEELQAKCADAYAVGIDLSAGMTVKDAKIYMVSSGIEQLDALRSAYAQLYYQQNIFQTDTGTVSYDSTNIVGDFTKEAKNRREITCEVLFFELTAVGFLGLAAVLFREKQMGVLRVHGIVPVSCAAFLSSKLLLFFISDLLFAVVLTMVNIGVIEGMIVLPTVLLQAGLLSLIMALLGFCWQYAFQIFGSFPCYILFLRFLLRHLYFWLDRQGFLGDG